MDGNAKTPSNVGGLKPVWMTQSALRGVAIA
jgi:hypothetical protein